MLPLLRLEIVVVMPRSLVPDSIPDLFWTHDPLMTVPELAALFEKSHSTIARWRKVVRRSSGNNLTDRGIPISMVTNYREMGTLKIKGDCLVASDWHIPFHSVKWVNRLVMIAKKEGIKQLAIPGDLFDASGISRFDSLDVEAGIGEELNTSSRMLSYLLQWFTGIYWSGGNHEIRLPRSLQFQVALPDICNFITSDKRVKAIDREELLLESGGVTYYIVHPSTYSRTPMNVSRELAEKFHTNVISAHGHSFGMSYSKSGEYLALDAGGLFDVDTTTYINRGGLTTNPLWTNGFWLIKDGIPIPYSEKTYKWKEGE